MLGAGKAALGTNILVYVSRHPFLHENPTKFDDFMVKDASSCSGSVLTV